MSDVCVTWTNVTQASLPIMQIVFLPSRVTKELVDPQDRMVPLETLEPRDHKALLESPESLEML